MSKAKRKVSKQLGRSVGRGSIGSKSNLQNNALRKPQRNFKLNIFGFEKLQDPMYGVFKRSIWLVAMCLCFIVCIWQLYDRISLYLSHPTAIQMTLNRTCKMDFPAFTICPAKTPFDVSTTAKLFEAANKSEFCVVNPKNCSDITHVSFDKLGLTLDEMWEEFSITENDVAVWTLCSSEEFKANRCDFSLNSTKSLIRKRPVDIVLGRCIIVSMDIGSKYNGASTFIEIQIMHRHYHDFVYQQLVAAQFYFQYQESVNKAFGVNLHEGLPMAEVISVRLQRKQFQNLNVSWRPCVDGDVLISCIERCADSAIIQHLPCRLPFVNTSELMPCETFLQASTAYKKARTFYKRFNPYNCACHPLCKEIVYSAYKTKVRNAIYENHTTLWIEFSDDLVEVAVEVATYKGGDLLSDIGGSLGFFLGICILHILEFFDELLNKGMKIVDAFFIKRRIKRQSVGFSKLNLSTSSYHRTVSLETENQVQICALTADRLIKIQRNLSPRLLTESPKPELGYSKLPEDRLNTEKNKIKERENTHTYTHHK